jgi:hypothetical protein
VIDSSQKTVPALIVDLLLHGLRVKDEKLNAIAAELFARQGSCAIRQLVLEAASKKNSPAHRLRLLAVIERIGQLPDPDDWFALNVLAADKNPKIREAVGRCLVRHSLALAPEVVGG